jgi:hypothetical protein
MTSEQEGDSRFYTSWAWKREHLPDKHRFKRPYIHKLENGVTLAINQAMFKAEGFASTGLQLQSTHYHIEIN